MKNRYAVRKCANIVVKENLSCRTHTSKQNLSRKSCGGKMCSLYTRANKTYQGKVAGEKCVHCTHEQTKLIKEKLREKNVFIVHTSKQNLPRKSCGEKMCSLYTRANKTYQGKVAGENLFIVHTSK